jgi:hypothetical protein
MEVQNVTDAGSAASTDPLWLTNLKEKLPCCRAVVHYFLAVLCNQLIPVIEDSNPGTPTLPMPAIGLTVKRTLGWYMAYTQYKPIALLKIGTSFERNFHFAAGKFEREGGREGGHSA